MTSTCDPSSVGTEWKRWLRSFQLYADGKGLIIVPDKDDNKVQRRALLLHCAGSDVQDIFDVLPNTGNAKEYQKAEDALTAHFVTQINIPYERHLFREMVQEENETVDQYAVRLRRKAQQCDYGDQMEAQIRDQIVSKCRSNELRRKLLEKGQALTLQNLQEIARNYEAVRRQTQSMNFSTEPVNRARESLPGRSNKKFNTLSGSECYRCGRRGHFARDFQCPARGKTCTKCSQVGHFANVCKTKFLATPGKSDVRYMQEDACGDDDEYVFAVVGGDSGGKVVVNIGGIPVEMIIDSGASANVISQASWEQLKKCHIKCVSKQNMKKLYAYGAVSPLEVVGTFTADVTMGKKCVSAEVTVVKGHGESLLGRETATELGVLKLQVPVNNVVDYSELMIRYKDVFTGIGKLKDFQLNLHIDQQVQPVAQPLRRPAFSLREKIEKKLDELLQEDIIEKVEGPTPWVNPVVVVPKPNGDVRLCVDMRCANQAIIRERHPIPTIDEVLEDMQEGSVFSKLDLKWGYHQIELNEESRGITTFVTHKGLFRYKRLMFGITSAPEKYQQVIQQVLQDCSGTANISDDIIIYGPNTAEHDKRLEKVLTRLKDRGLTLNKEKCVFHMPKLTFMGLVLSRQGIGPTEEKVKAVNEACEPQSVSEVKSFLGLVNFNARFIPDLATVAEPLRRLTKKGEPFVFGPEQQAAFTELKRRLTQAETLGYFDRNAKTKIIADASPVGLGAVLVQEHNGENRVICYASRGLSEVERRYSQTEREALGLVWACEKFHVYLYGIEFELWTDHKPLEFIYSTRSRPSARIERWVLRLQPYLFSVKYLPGQLNIADALSRLTKIKEAESRSVAEEYIRFVANTAVPQAMTAEEIERESAVDDELGTLRECIKTGNWENYNCPGYKPIRDELCLFGNIVLRGTRIVVPKKLRGRVIELGHEGHQGLVKMKQRLRTKVWWPGMDKDAETFCKTCHGCQVAGGLCHPEPLHMTELPQGPWQDIAVDFMGPLPSGDYVFAVTDYYSRYVEISISKRNTAEVAINSLKKMFATHGLPYTVTSDNGPHFVAEAFETFLKDNGIKHRKITPLWPQANGEIERQNRSLLKRMQIAQVEGKDWKEAVQTYLVAYRNTPHPSTGVCPSELLFGRTLRTKLPGLREAARLDEEVRDRDQEKKIKMKEYSDRTRKAEESNLMAGDKVLLKQPRANKWTTRFESQPYELIDKCGNSVVIKSPEGAQYKRNSTHVKLYHEREKPEGPEKSAPHEVDVGDVASDLGEMQQSQKERDTTPVKSPRPVRTRQAPKRFEDFVLE